MPLYEYRCPRCGDVTERIMAYDRRDEPRPCDWGCANVQRVMSVPAPMPSSKDRPGRGRNP